MGAWQIAVACLLLAQINHVTAVSKKRPNVPWAGPTYVERGYVGHGTGASLTPRIPINKTSGDIMIAHTITEATTLDHSYPAGWAEVAEVAGTGHESSWAWKRSDGTETGLTVTLTGNTTMAISVIYLFRGCVGTGNPYENNNDTSAASNAPRNKLITLGGSDRLAVSLLGIEDNVSPSSWTNSWTEQSDTTSAAGNDGCVVLLTKNYASGSTSEYTAGSLGTSENWTFFNMSLIPD